MIGRAGHALSEPGISAELVRSMDMLGTQRVNLGL
jgi:proline iminopeptidase